MKKFLLGCLLLLGVSVPVAHAQTVPYNAQYGWTKVTTIGPVGTVAKDQYLDFSKVASGLPVFHSLSFVVTGTAPTVCTFRIEGSLDFINWFAIDVAPPSTESCTTSGLVHVPYKPVRGLRVNMIGYTAGNATTSVIFNYAGSK
jgi:hypothetical protein